jgi:hypothetical protein
MTFEEKVAAIEEARKTYPEFNQEFVDYLGLGHSFNGAYNHFNIEHIKKYEKPEATKPQVVNTPKAKTTKPEIPVKK